MKHSTLVRIMKNFYEKGCMGVSGSFDKDKRKQILLELIQLGYISPECQITKQGKDFVLNEHQENMENWAIGKY